MLLMGGSVPLYIYLGVSALTVLENVFPMIPDTSAFYQSKSVRNHQIRARYASGELMIDLSRDYGISPQRVSQIIHGQ